MVVKRVAAARMAAVGATRYEVGVVKSDVDIAAV